MADVRFVQATRVYPGNDQPAVDALDLEIADGEFMVLVGPSGSGKTTALRMLAGLEEIDAGAVFIGERDVSDIPPKQRDVSMVFQNYALYPYLTVAANIGFPLRIAGVKKRERELRVKEVAKMLGLTEFLERKPAQLSGGQRQRVAMGRAIIRTPSVFLMDEPLSNLDAKLRVQMRAEISELQRNLGVTTLYVTHDQVEAMTMGDRVAVMEKGVVQQIAAPREIYDDPANLFVAGFIGSPAMNLLEATLHRDDGAMKVVAGSQEIALSRETLEQRPELQAYDGREVVLGIRPEDLEDRKLAGETAHGGMLEGKVTLREALGSEIMVHFSVDASPAFTADVKELAEDVGDAERAEAHARKDSAILVGRFGARSRVKSGDQVEVAVDTRQLHFFDVDTGLGIYGDA